MVSNECPIGRGGAAAAGAGAFFVIADASITPVARIEARCEDRAWPWAERNHDAIQARWDAARAEQPALFDGSVFLCTEPWIDAGVLRIVCFETRYSNFY